MTRWNLSISEKTDRLVRSHLARIGMKKGDLSKFVDTAVRTIRESPRLPGVERIWLPGEQSHAKSLDRRVHGIPMPKALRESLDGVARDLKVAALQ